MKNYLDHYLTEHKAAIDSIPLVVVEEIILKFTEALKTDRQIFVFGNGGSAANASHFITDLGKGASDKTFRRFRCMSLNDNTAWITAIGNDYSYDDIFYRQLENYAKEGDLVMMMSVSGNSPNLIKAVEYCKNNKILSIALTGKAGGKIADMADLVLKVDSDHYGRVEDCHMHICHMIAYAFMEN
ncbi:SIS domain-containing protein [Sphingobacterium sp. 1.A.5]|uniref:D-sedoheptulose-7-phosphate isomerase n=1 Tax=Sphingobacterium sp. 1.A.5 TaxID=2044604 RepID=UPI000C0BC295|nr:SIS domain-containing protein [Sphingobacterium sp. 1.A.5]